MIQFTGIDTKSHTHSAQQKPKKAQKNIHFEQKAHRPNQKKIGFAEGTELFFNGAVKQGKELINSIIKHPLKTAAIIGVTSLGLMALPLIGIPSAVGGGVLAIAFAGFSIAKAVKHAAMFSKTYKEGAYDKARLHIQQLGEDTFDIALSAPFVPKAVSNIKNFVSYGKLGVNTALVSEIKNSKGVFKKLKTLVKADAEISRNLNFQQAVDKEIKALTDLTEAQRTQIKKELLEFNISTDKIPDLVLEKYAQAKGVATKPDVKYITMSPNTHGMAVANNCTIYLNDNKPFFGKGTFADFVEIKQELKGGEYFITYKNKNTGAIITEIIEKNLLDQYNKMCTLYRKLSPEAQRILTIIHEREHIHQFAQVCNMKGFDWLKGDLKPRGKELLEQMIAEMPKVKLGTPEALKIESYLIEAANGTPVAYIKRPLEIGARALEAEAMANPTFIPLNNVFNTVKQTKGLSLTENIILNTLRTEAADS